MCSASLWIVTKPSNMFNAVIKFLPFRSFECFDSVNWIQEKIDVLNFYLNVFSTFGVNTSYKIRIDFCSTEQVKKVPIYNTIRTNSIKSNLYILMSKNNKFETLLHWSKRKNYPCLEDGSDDDVTEEDSSSPGFGGCCKMSSIRPNSRASFGDMNLSRSILKRSSEKFDVIRIQSLILKFKSDRKIRILNDLFS